MIRLEERERYRKLLAEYTSTSSLFDKSVLDGSYISKPHKKEDPISLEDDRFPRYAEFSSYAPNYASRLVALGCGFIDGWYIFPDSPGTFYLPRVCHGLLLLVVLSSL